MTQAISAIVLAAGHGKRMQSTRPKPLHHLCGRPMLQYVLDSLRGLSVERVVLVVGQGAEQVTKEISASERDLLLDFVEQRTQRGTGDAASVGLTAFADEYDDDSVIVLPGDTPLLRGSTMAEFVQRHFRSGAACTVLTADLGDPTGYGRIVRDRDGSVARVVEHKDASPDELAITEVNTSVYCFRRSLLAPALRRVTPENAQGEYYLTDVVEVLYETGHPLDSYTVGDAAETQGVNDRVQLAAAEAVLRSRINHEWMKRGVTLVDPQHVYIDGTVELSQDVTVFPDTMLRGRTVVGRGARIGPGSDLTDCAVGERAVVVHAVGRDAEVGPRAVVGPFAVLEPGAQVAADARLEPFYTAKSADQEG